MKFEIKQNSLMNAINIANRAVSKNTNIQIHELIYFQAENDILILTAFDGEITIRTSVKAKVIEKGEAAIKANLFTNIIRKLPDEIIRIEKNDGKINIRNKSSNFNLIAFEYFEKKDIELPHTNPIEIANDKLKRSIVQTEFATSLDETKLALTGILFEIKDSNLTMVALDGYRVALKKNKIEYQSVFENQSFIIPKRSLIEWSRIISDDDITKIYKADNDLAFQSQNTTMYCRVIDKNFIDYRNIINDASDTSVLVDKMSLVSALDRAQVLSDPGRANLIRIEITDDAMVIKSNSEIGDVKEVIGVKKEGPNLNIAFNARYMQEGVRAFDSDKIKLNFKSSLNPCLIYPIDSRYEDENLTYLVLPVRLAN
ncbi:DNA polymerase III subunit beta [Anaerococcus sp. Marseille-P3625]|uniref:DNA polymerase III subunit beta n=1 Tax=Anaerococcus sp. Marseille-P3625 TaxID=1977277 RepID=UPI000C07F4F9|nr:DNA polymerase III subunit beta [Anaerococcus sp. Marseille-P3625]